MCQSPSHSGILIVCIANIGILGISAMNLNLWLMLMDNNSTFSTTAKLKGKKIKKNKRGSEWILYFQLPVHYLQSVLECRFGLYHFYNFYVECLKSINHS